MKKKKAASSSAFLNPRVLLGLALCLFGAVLSLFAAGVLPESALQSLSVSAGAPTQLPGVTPEFEQTANGPAYVHRDFQVRELTKHSSAKIDLRKLPFVVSQHVERPEFEEPEPAPRVFVPPNGGRGTTTSLTSGKTKAPTIPIPTLNAPAPAASLQFDGLDFATWGAGHPPDENGDVGPTYYIQTVNTSIGIYQKSNGNRVAAFTFNTFFNGHFGGNLCETQNFGDPVVVYDSFEDRWIITDFAFTVNGSGAITSNVLQCVAASQSGDPVNGGWNFYSIVAATGGAINDYPKFAVWPDGLYMSANLFNAAGSGVGTQEWAFNKAQMYAGAPTVQVISFITPDTSEFTLIPANARLQTGSPAVGTPAYFVSTWEFTNAQEIYKFHVDWNSVSLSTLTGPLTSIANSVWPNAAVANAVTPKNALDPLQIRNMFSTMYTNISGVESLWAAHTVRRNTAATSTTALTTGFAAPRWYQIPVTGGTVGPNDTQSATWDPEGASTNYRYCPSLAVDRAGDMAMGYTLSNSTTNPSIRYAGRLAGDAGNSFSQTEQVMINGTGSQTGTCGTTCIRWGDYSRMALDPDGCTFWYTNEYYLTNDLNDLTRIGKFTYPQCTPVGTGGTVNGTVIDSNTTNPLNGATVLFGARTMSTDVNGNYSFTPIPAGTYTAGMSASYPGYATGTAASEIVTDSGTTTQNFALLPAPTSGCPTDNSQATFQTGTGTNIDMTTNPGQVILTNPTNLDQQMTTISASGVGITTTGWAAQTFTAGLSGQMTKADMSIFCSGCTGTSPNLTLSLRGTTAGLPTGADLAAATIAGNNSGASAYLTGTFASPPTLTAGTLYALVIRPTANPSVGTYAVTRSGSNVYTTGNGFTNAASGADGSWSNATLGGTNRDFGFHNYVQTGFAASGNFISGAKDANPATGWNPTWGTLTWTASTPANTNVQFQAAASNNPAGVFNFVGPDNTANTFFTNGGSLAQFNGNRYLRYKAILTSTNSAVTPALTSATACFQDLAPAPVLQSVASRLTHGNGAGTFDLPLSTSSGVIEPRSDGTGNYTIVFTYDKPVNAGNANITAPAGGSVNNVSFSGNSMIVSLTGINDIQTVTVTPSGVAGTNTQTAVAASVQVGFLIGDVNADGAVNVGDTIVVRNAAGATIDNTNFTDDVNLDGMINVADTNVVRSKAGDGL